MFCLQTRLDYIFVKKESQFPVVLQNFLEQLVCLFPKQLSRGVLKKRCYENMKAICLGTLMPKYDSNKVANHFTIITLWHGCSPVNLLHIFKTFFPTITSGEPLVTFLGNFFYHDRNLKLDFSLL